MMNKYMVKLYVSIDAASPEHAAEIGDVLADILQGQAGKHNLAALEAVTNVGVDDPEVEEPMATGAES